MILSASDLALLRSRPHRTNLYLSIYQPKTVMACQVNDASITKAARTIAYNNVTTTGTYLNVEADMLMLIGSSAGASDVGTIRVRSAASGSFLVAENADIVWADDQYLTVLDYVDVVPIFPHTAKTGEGDMDITFYKDYDIVYSNQNTVLGTLICAGPHRAAFLDSGAAQVYYTSSGTYNVNGSTLSYHWQFEGGTPGTYDGATPGYVSYGTAGHYRTRLIVSGSAGEVDTTYRYVSIYDRPNEGPHLPILQFELSSLEGNRASSGYTAKVRVHQILPTMLDNSLVVIFAEDWYGSTKASIGGNALNNSSIVFAGYVVSDSVSYDYQSSYTEFVLCSITDLMKNLETLGMNYESVGSPATWYQLKDLTISKAIYAYLRWHSTVLKTTDVRFMIDDWHSQYFDADRASLLDGVSTFIRVGMAGEVVSDRQGVVWIERSPESKANALSTVPISMDIDKRDWRGEPKIDERRSKVLAYLEAGGIAYSGSTTGTFVALLAGAPGFAPAYRGRSDSITSLILTDQDQLNELAGDIFANRNAKYPSIMLMMAGNYRNLDIAPLEACRMTIQESDTVRRITMTNKPFYLTSMQWSFSPQDEALLVDSAIFSEVTEGNDADTIEVPVAPPDEGFQIPEIQIPAIPQITFPSLWFPFIDIGAGAYAEAVKRYGSANILAGDTGLDDAPLTSQEFAYGTSINGNSSRLRINAPGVYHVKAYADVHVTGGSGIISIGLGNRAGSWTGNVPYDTVNSADADGGYIRLQFDFYTAVDTYAEFSIDFTKTDDVAFSASYDLCIVRVRSYT